MVTITDNNQCQEVLTFVVDVMVGISDIEGLSELILRPNPTTGMAILDITFANPTDVSIELLNPIGQILWNEKSSAVQSRQFELNLNDHSSGMYFVRIVANNQIHLERLMKLR